MQAFKLIKQLLFMLKGFFIPIPLSQIHAGKR